ncbi:MAG: cytochrome c [Rhodospirillum sp.]|nr:cytochrome c [Rhodospirillum sp.]MCF8488759.1 cytochrome c [Rhodospirillum sp.]MCF8499711.1 cytochrome c [Rhodospirillum sp.]
MRILTLPSIAALALVGGIALLGTSGAMAQAGAEGVVKERIESMKAMKTAMKIAGPMVNGVMTYDADEVKKAAEAIAAGTGEALTKMFPEGSTDGESDALPEIWSEWSRFEGLAKDTETKAKVLAAFSGEQSKAAAAFDALEPSCKACHRAFKD